MTALTRAVAAMAERHVELPGGDETCTGCRFRVKGCNCVGGSPQWHRWRANALKASQALIDARSSGFTPRNQILKD